MSHRTWARYGLDRSVVGSSITINGTPMTVVGVASQGFFGDTLRADATGVWIPLGQEPVMRGANSLIERPNQDWLYAIGRLRPGASPEQAGARLTAALQQWLGELIQVEAVDVSSQDATLRIVVQYTVRRTQERRTADFVRGGPQP